MGDDALTAREAWLGCMGASQAVMWSNGTLLTWETWPVFTEDAVELQPDGVLRVTIVVENSGPRRFVTSTCNVTGTLDAPTIFWQGFEYSE